MIFPFIRILWYVAVEVYKTVAEINPKFMWTYFLKNLISYDLPDGWFLLVVTIEHQIWIKMIIIIHKKGAAIEMYSTELLFGKSGQILEKYLREIQFLVNFLF